MAVKHRQAVYLCFRDQRPWLGIYRRHSRLTEVGPEQAVGEGPITVEPFYTSNERGNPIVFSHDGASG